MMHSSSSVGAGPYDPGGATEDKNTSDDASLPPSTTKQNQHDMHEDESSHTKDLQNKQKPEVSQQPHHRRPRPQHSSEEDLTPLRPNPNPNPNASNGGSGWCDLTIEYDRTGGTSELDDFSFAPAAGTAAIVASDNHEYMQGGECDDYNDEEAEGENDYVWGPQHLFSPRYNFALKSNQYGQHGGFMYEAASAAAASARSSGRQLVGSLYSHLPSSSRRSGLGNAHTSELSTHSADDNVDNELPYELAPPAPPIAASMSRGYSNGGDSDSLTRDIVSSSVHTETYIFDDDQNIVSTDKFIGDDEPLFSRGESMPSDVFPAATSEDDDTSYATANAEANDGVEETALTGISLADDDGDEAIANNCDVTDNKEEDTSHSPEPRTPQMRSVASTQDSDHDGDDYYFYNADEQTTSLRSEVVEVLQEDIGRVNEAFLDTIHKTSALVEPIAAVARRQSTSLSPVRQRLSGLSQSVLGIKRSVSERTGSAVAVVIPTRQSIRENSNRLEETILHAAHEAEKSAIATAGKAMPHIHVPVPSMKIPEVISDALESVEAAAEELRVNDVDFQSGVDDAELLSQLTAGAYA